MPHITAVIVLDQLSRFFADVLKFFNGFTHNFGWNVILLTVAFRVVVLPLSFKQTKSMIAMQRLQPQLKEIQKKYKDDREKQGQAMMGLYKENKVSPLGGCLPLILQLPILFALFEVLRNAPKYVHYKTDFIFLGINNLIATGQVLWKGGTVQYYNPTVQHLDKLKIPSGQYLAVIGLILFTIATGYVSSKMMTNDPKQAKMMALMPVVFGVFAWILPAGVTIYIIVTNVTMVIQQYVQLEAEGFYDEKRTLRMKTGDPLKWYERWRYKGYDYGSVVLTAVHIKNPKKLEQQRADRQAVAKRIAKGETSKKDTGKGAEGKAAPGKGTPAKKAAKPGGQTPGKKAAKPATRATDKAAKPGATPAKKPSGQGQTPAAAPAEEKTREASEADEAREPKGTEPEPDAAGQRPEPKQQTGGQPRQKQYPAKKKSSGKK